MGKYFLLLFSVMLAVSTVAQKRTITGTVRDYSSHFGVTGCNIVEMENKVGTLTNGNGKFILAVPQQEQVTLILSCLNYQTDTVVVSVNEQERVFYLKAKPDVLEEIVVTGVTRAARIRENPVPVVQVSALQIGRATESNLMDVLVKNVPGMSAVKTGPNITKPFIRGLGYNRVLTMYDGIRQEGQQYGDEHGIEIDDYQIERVEVIKGPASLLYGSDALAGVISLFPHIPSQEDGKVHGKFLSEYQSNNNLIGSGLRLDFSNQKLLFALRGSYRMAKNYRNPVDGRVYLTNFSEKNLSALAGYKSRTGSHLLNFTLYDNTQGIPDGTRDSASRRFTHQIYEGDFDDPLERPVVSVRDLSSYKVPALSQHIRHYRLYLRNEFFIGDGKADVSIAAQQNIRTEYTHPSVPHQAGMNMRLNTLNYGARYDLPTFSGIGLSAGINGMFQQNKHRSATDFPIPDYQLADGGIYVYGMWKRNRWNVSGGVRYDLRRVSWHDFYVGVDAATGFNKQATGADTADADLQFEKYNKSFRGLSAGLGATYRVSPQLSVKANIARGYRAPNVTEMGSNGLDPGARIIYIGNRFFQPEFSLQQDLGLHLDLKHLKAEVSLFNNHIDNYIFQSLVVDDAGQPLTDAQGNKTYEYQQSAAHLYGAEFWFAIQPEQIRGFKWDNSFSIVHGVNQKNTYKGKGVLGEYLPMQPPTRLWSSVSQQIKPRSKVIFLLMPVIEGEFTAAQNRYYGINDTETATPSHAIFNAGIHTDLMIGNLEPVRLSFFVSNLFNTAYQSHLNRLKYMEFYSQSPNGRLGIYNPGRNVTLKMTVNF